MSNLNIVYHSPQFKVAAENIAQTGRFLAGMGWSPATSSNYSVRLNPQAIAITRTGVDKHNMTAEDVILVDQTGKTLAPTGEKPSAETLVHTTVYNEFPEVGSVLHTHSPLSTRLSLNFLIQKELVFEGYEIQKALQGHFTHDTRLVIPIVENSQDMTSLSKMVATLLETAPDTVAFLLAGHGLYTWAKDLESARRHVEALEFLFECKALELRDV